MNLVRTVAKTATALLVCACISCENEQDITIGSEVLPGSSLEFKEVEIENAVNLTQVSTQRVQTNNLPYYRLGKSANAKYDLVLKPRVGRNLPNVQADAAKPDTLYRFSSAKVVLSYRFETDSTTVVDDTRVSYLIKAGRQQNADGKVQVKLFDLDQNIQTNDGSNANNNIYYADGSRPSGENLNLNVATGELANVSIEAPLLDRFEIDVTGNAGLGDTNLQRSKNVEGVSGEKKTALEIASDGLNQLFQNHFSSNPLSVNDLTTKTQTEFIGEFEAFYLQTVADETNNVFEVLPQDTSTTDVSPVLSRIEIAFDLVADVSGTKFKVKDTNGNDVDLDKQHLVYFYLNNDGGFFDTEAAGQNINIITELNTVPQSESEVYLRNGIGSVGKLELFSESDPNNNGKNLLESLFEGNIISDFNKDDVISKAVLRFTVKGTEEGLPGRLVLNRNNLRLGTESLFLTDFNNNVSSIDLLKANHLIEKSVVDGNTVYDIVITEHLQQILNQDNVEGAKNLNFDMTLSIFNEGDRIAAIPGLNTVGGETQTFFMLEGTLLSDGEVKISNSNDETETALKPKLIVKFTPTN